MKTPLAWYNSIDQPRRTAASVGGVCFALLLIFMQAGFLSAAKTNVSVIYLALDGDLVIHSKAYLTMQRSDLFNRLWLSEAVSVPGVQRVSRVLIGTWNWRNPTTGSTARLYAIGVPTDAKVFLDPKLNDQMSTLNTSLTVLVDRNSHNLGPWKVGDKTMINGKMVTITGEYSLGMGLLGDGSTIASEQNYEALDGPWITHLANIGLIKLAPGADRATVLASLRKHLPSDVTVVTREELIAHEQNYFINVKPVGLLFKTGMVVAFAAGAAILYQILASEMNNRLGEFATLKALGYKTSKIYSLGLQQGFIYAMLAYGPALVLSMGLYSVARKLSGFPVYMDLSRAIMVFCMAVVMCTIAAIFSLWKIRNADPASLFK